MKILVFTRSVEENTSGDFAHGLSLVKSLIREEDIQEVSWLMFFDYEFSPSIQQRYEELASAVDNDKFPPKNIIPVRNTRSGLRGIGQGEVLAAELARSNYDLVILHPYFTQGGSLRHCEDFEDLPEEKRKIKMIFIGEYNYKKKPFGEMPTLYTGFTCPPDDDRARLGVYANSVVNSNLILDELVEKNKITLVTDGAAIKMEDVNFAYLRLSDRADIYNHYAFINICIEVARHEGREQCTIVLNTPTSELETYISRHENFRLVKKDKDCFEFTRSSSDSVKKVRIMTPFPLRPETFQYLLKESHLLVGATGDSSYVEALSKHKLVLHDGGPILLNKRNLMEGYYLLLKKYLPAHLQVMFDVPGYETTCVLDVLSDKESRLPSLIAEHKPQILTALQSAFEEIKAHHSLETNLWPAIKVAIQPTPVMTANVNKPDDEEPQGYSPHF